MTDSPLKPTDELHILVGGPYTFDGEEHRYGHTALRVKTKKYDLTYDFGRYGVVTGTFGESGEGILRVWSDFSAYIKGENQLKRVTTDFVFLVFDAQADAVVAYFEILIKSGTPRSGLQKGRGALKVYKLANQYTALENNCTTLSMDGAKRALPKIDQGSTEYIKPEVAMSWSERAAMKTLGGGTPNRIFLPANLQEFLQNAPGVKPNRVETHGSRK